jgi:hypothetical protein
MTSKDRPQDKLLGSMRKTKAAAGAAVVENVEETAVERKAEAKTAKPAAASDTRDITSSQPVRGGADSYQSGQRVWPD